MKLSIFIAKRVAIGKQEGFSKYMIRIAITATALSLATMIIASCMVKGFRYEIAQKIYNFWGNVEVKSIESGSGYEDEPISRAAMYKMAQKPGIAHVQSFIVKPGIIKVNDEIESVVLKGVGPGTDWETMKDYLIGTAPLNSNDTVSPCPVIVSTVTAQRLKLVKGDKLHLYFALRTITGTEMSARVCKVSGFYKTGLNDFDKMFVLCNLSFLQKINKWNSDEVGGYEIYINKEADIDAMGRTINTDYLDQSMIAKTLHEIYPNIFDWLNLQNLNEQIILALMTIVAIVNLITMLLILIIERSTFIGVMKSIGASNGLLRSVFVWQAGYIIAVGLAIGNISGILICLIEKYFKVIKLPEDSYFVDHAPVYFDPLFIIVLNAAVLVITLVVMLIPAWLITRIEPVKVLRFD
jgi:lipoprotein-releasing system permease protein